MENKYCIYAHINPLKNEIFYIGKGVKTRPKEKKSRNEFWWNIVKKYGYIVDILEEGLTNEEAFERERYYIAKIGRRDLGKGTLVNHTDGGDKCYNMSPITKEKLRQANLGKKASEETKEKMKNSSKKVWSNNELRELKRKQTLDLIERGILNQKGKPSKKKGIPLSEELKEKLKLSLKKYYNEGNKPHNYIEIDEEIKKQIFNDYENGIKKFNLHKKYNLSRTIIERLIKEYDESK